MVYEDPNAPPLRSSSHAEITTAPVDQNTSFLEGASHPWRRFFARMVDICTAGLVLFLLLVVILSVTMPEQAAGFAKAIENPIIASVVLYLVWLPAEAVFLWLFGTTPAKWLFGIKVVHPGGDLLSISDALTRSFLVFVQGIGLGIPLIALFTQLFAYRRLTKTGTTLWDRSASAVVIHKEWGVLRALICTGAVFGVLILMSALNAVGNQ
jgi:uncharacterized RDD family membrane protein YckC